MQTGGKESKKFPFFRNVLALGLVSFFTDISSEMVFSLLPTFILDLSGSSITALGIIEGIAENLSYSLRAFSGFISDKLRKRKLIVLIGYALSNIVKPLFAAAQSISDVLIIRISDRVGKAIRTAPRDALLSDSASKKKQGIAFGIHRTLDQTGAIIGPLLASIFLFFGFSTRMVFWFSFIPGLIALLILIHLVKEEFSGRTQNFRMLSNLKEILKGKFFPLLIIVGIFSLGAFNFSFILLNAKESGIADELIPLIYLVINLIHTLIAIPAGLLSDKVGQEKVLTFGYGIFFITCLLIFSLPKTYLCAFIVAASFGLYAGIIETTQRALIPKYAERSDLRGTAYGLYYLMVGAALLVANMIVGLIWQQSGSSIAMIYSMIVVMVAMLGMAGFILRSQK